MTENKKTETDIKEKLVAINRITKVVKGGRRFGFAALVVVGNQKGSVGIGQGKSKQVPDAIKKATEVAKRNLIKIPLKEGRTLHHDVKGKNGSGKVFLRSLSLYIVNRSLYLNIFLFSEFFFIYRNIEAVAS